MYDKWTDKTLKSWVFSCLTIGQNCKLQLYKPGIKGGICCLLQYKIML